MKIKPAFLFLDNKKSESEKVRKGSNQTNILKWFESLIKNAHYIALKHCF